MRLWILALLCLTFCCSVTDSLTGKVCYQKKSKSVSYTATRTTYTSSRYSTSCGFLGWKSCTRYRRKSQKSYSREFRTTYYSHAKCCSGWRVDSTGYNCDIHDRVPLVRFCPASFTVQATGRTQPVSWRLPDFREPHNYGLEITSRYSVPSATLPWGDTVITYIAKSKNNQKTAQCRFTITVTPPLDHPVITGPRTDIKVVEGVSKSLECRADHGYPAFKLTWYFGGKETTTRTTYKTERHGFKNLQNAISTITFTPSRDQDGMDIECRATKPGRTESDRWKLVVMFDPDPLVDFCPSNIERTIYQRNENITRRDPVFREVNDDPLSISCNYGKVQTFTYGDYVVHCSARNTATNREATCRYNLTILAAKCAYPRPPGNGSVACGYFAKDQVQVCQYMCKAGNDVMFNIRVPNLLVCTLDGGWFPKIQHFNCARKRSVVNYMPSHKHYMTGSCSDSGNEARAQFTQILKYSLFSKLCTRNSCEPDEFSRICH